MVEQFQANSAQFQHSEQLLRNGPWNLDNTNNWLCCPYAMYLHHTGVRKGWAGKWTSYDKWSKGPFNNNVSKKGGWGVGSEIFLRFLTREGVGSINVLRKKKYCWISSTNNCQSFKMHFSSYLKKKCWKQQIFWMWSRRVDRKNHAKVIIGAVLLGLMEKWLDGQPNAPLITLTI